MRGLALPLLLVPALVAGCAKRSDKTPGTLAEMQQLRPDVEDATVEQGFEQAMEHYRRFLEETPETEMTPEAMRRLADLQIERQFGADMAAVKPQPMATPEIAGVHADTQDGPPVPPAQLAGVAGLESDQDFEARTTATGGIPVNGETDATGVTALLAEADPSGPLEAIALYDRLLAEYPNYEHRDKVFYQKARAYDELGRTEEAIATMELLIGANPHSEHLDEVQFRRGEYFFTRKLYLDAENAYSAIIHLGAESSYYELALYKLGWTFYKQELYEEALHRYVTLLDHRASIGYDFEQAQGEEAQEDERRVADTFRVVSLSLNNLGGPNAVPEYFSTFGNRSYEHRVYSNLGEHYLAKLRYNDAAKTFTAFVELYPFDRAAPRFSMRVVDTFTEGSFPKLVLESKREFASKYGLQAEYWHHFDPEEAPEVLSYLRTNLNDLATHYHAEYQATEEPDERVASYHEALRWYRDYLTSFPEDADAPAINYRLADLQLEHEDFGEAARQYERTAYEYEPHGQSAAAGYAAVYAYRKQLGAAGEEAQDAVKRSTVASSLRFVDTFPEHEHAAAVLGAAAENMYEMKEFAAGIEAARRLIDGYPEAETAIRRSAWVVLAHGSFELADFEESEQAYATVLAGLPEDDESHAGFVDNLAASIYKQGELAGEAEDHRAAADHFLRIRSSAPTSTLRATAEYDAGAALIRLEEWSEAAEVLEAFRRTFPEHEMQLEATRQIAYAYREDGRLSDAAGEYERIFDESDDPQLRSNAMLVAGDLYEQSGVQGRALEAYRRYVDTFPQPVETALETRLKISDIYKSSNDDASYRQELAAIVRIDAEAGSERTGRTRTIAGRSALILAERLYDDFVTVKLRQPFEESLLEKQQRMDATIEAMGRLVDYEIAEVTAAATYYMAETHFDFSRSLNESERPDDLEAAELAEYELVLEEEAFPYEERAIDVHEKNFELLQAGVFNPWTEKSLDKLAELVPGRYAKREMSSELFGTIVSYEYRSPAAPIEVPVLDGAEPADPTAAGEPAATTQLIPNDTDYGETEHATPH